MKRTEALTALLSFAFCCLLFSRILAQESSFPIQHFERITTEQGLSNNSVRKILQDKKGFLWFLTFNGLDRYDGYTFKNYSYSPEHSQYIMPGYFSGMDEDSSGIIWLGSNVAGIYSFNP